MSCFFFFQAEDGIRDDLVTGVQTCALPIFLEMTEVQTRLLAEGGPAVLFENAVQADGRRSTMPVLVNLLGTVARVAWGMDRLPHQPRQGGETPAFPRQPEPPGRLPEALELPPP